MPDSAGVTCVLITGSLQPYAIDFYRGLERAMNAIGWRLLILVGSRSTYRPWSSIGVSDDDPLFKFVPGTPAPEWVQRLLGSSSRDKILLPGGSGLVGLLADLNPDLLILNERNPLNLRAACWAHGKRIPCVLSTDIGACPLPHAATRLHLVYHRLIRRLFDGVIAKTKDGETAFVKAGAPAAVLAPHGIDTDRFPLGPVSGKSEPFCFLFVGVLEASKGLDDLVAAGHELYSKGYRFVIRLVGTGTWKPSEANAGAPWLSFAGFQEGASLLKEYQAASAFILPSLGDTYGVVVHEAASCGLPLIVSTAAGASETLVVEGESGYRVAPRDPIALAHRMANLMDDPHLCARLGQGAREQALHWCTRRSGERVVNWLRQLLPRDARGLRGD